MHRRLQPQLRNPEELKDVLREAPVAFKLADGREVKTLLIYLPIRSGSSDHSVFFQKIKESILSNFVFSCKEVERKLGVSSSDSAENLFNKALRKLSHKTAQGELGELILFTLLDVYFQAPKLLSKVSQKQNRRMPVYGADAVHGQFYGSEFRLYFGESKLYTSFHLATVKAVGSIKTAKDKYEEEFDLLDSHMDFPGMDPETESMLLDILDPFSGHDPAERIHSPCFIGFAEPEMISNAKSEADFLGVYTKLACSYVNDFFVKAEKQGISIEETALLMLPYTCVNTLVADFITFLGIRK